MHVCQVPVHLRLLNAWYGWQTCISLSTTVTSLQVKRGSTTNDAVNILIAKHVGSSPVQTSLLAQSSFSVVDDDSRRIVYDESHWVAAACYDGQVFVASSLGDTILPVVAKQLKQLFAGDGSQAEAVNDVCCAHKPNGPNCAVFAAAFVFEWATSNFTAECDSIYVSPSKGRKCYRFFTLPPGVTRENFIVCNINFNVYLL